MIINDKAVEFRSGCTLYDVLRENNYNVDTVVVQLNGEIITKDRFNSVKLNENDTIEVLNFVGGG